MGAMGEDQRRMMEDATVDKFPEGLRVLAVDDNYVYLKVLEAVLRHCKYNPTMAMDAKTAMKMLRAGKVQFDLVITDVHMPDMDGFKLLELIGLEMDLPVIVLSVDCDKKVVLKGINHGACDYLMKPVCTNDLKNIWQHVESRRRSQATSHMSMDNADDQRVLPGTHAMSKDSKDKRNDEYDSNKNKESTHSSTTQKKPRVAWTTELHNKFLEAINQIGLDDGFSELTQMLDDGDANGILPVQESMVNQQDLDDLLNGIKAFSSDDIADLLNDDFIGEDGANDGEL
ncbi:Two-component response regulator ARR12 [Hordeum vulgare]|nr:Two-component response regulator ARR12 [Hordeum vulgare]